MSTSTRPWPLKLATILFSGGLATVAVARAGLAGCDIAAPPDDPRPQTHAPPTSPRALDFWGDNDLPQWPGLTPDALKPDAWFHLYTLERRLLDTPEEPEPPPPRYFGGAKADPFAMPPVDRAETPAVEDSARQLPPDYFGGAKSDAEVWGDLDAAKVAEQYGVGGLGLGEPKPRAPARKRGRR